MDWQKSIIQKDIIYYFIYREFSGIFRIINSDNSIQINIKFTFTFTVCKYTIVYNIWTCVFCLLQHCHNTTHDGHTGFTFKYSFPAGFTWLLSLVETAYPIVIKIQVINKEARAT